MPTMWKRVQRRNRRGGFEILVAGLALFTGMAFFGDQSSPVPDSIQSISMYISYAWGMMFLLGSVGTILGVLSGNLKFEFAGLTLFFSCCLAYIPALIYNGGASAIPSCIIVAYAALNLWYRIDEIADETNTPTLRRRRRRDG